MSSAVIYARVDYPTPYTLHPIPYNLYPTPYILHRNTPTHMPKGSLTRPSPCPTFIPTRPLHVHSRVQHCRAEYQRMLNNWDESGKRRSGRDIKRRLFEVFPKQTRAGSAGEPWVC